MLKCQQLLIFVGILTFISLCFKQEITSFFSVLKFEILCSDELSMKKMHNVGPGLTWPRDQRCLCFIFSYQ